MKVIVVDNPLVGLMLELFLGLGKEDPMSKSVTETDKVDHKTAGPAYQADPDFYTKPAVAKALVLKVKSNTELNKMYDVTQDRMGNLYCTCMGFRFRGTCRHIKKVQEAANKTTGLGLCLRCFHFTRNEADIGAGRNDSACRSTKTISCPPLSACRHFLKVTPLDVRFEATKTPAEPKVMPMVFPVEGALLQTFQSCHVPGVKYEVRMKNGKLACTCRGFNFHGSCKHVHYMSQHVNQSIIRI